MDEVEYIEEARSTEPNRSPEPTGKIFGRSAALLSGLVLFVMLLVFGTIAILRAKKPETNTAQRTEQEVPGGQQDEQVPLPVAIPNNDPPVPFDVRAVDLYKDNRLAADEKYKGRRVAYTGRVAEIGEIDGSAAVAFYRIGGFVHRDSLGSIKSQRTEPLEKAGMLSFSGFCPMALSQ
jgi:hypothetical protein